MDITSIEISKEEFSKIPEAEQVLFLQFGNIVNELHILLKILILSNPNSENEIENKGRITQKIYFDLLLIGKLWEFWQFLNKQYFGKNISKKYDLKLNDRTTQALEYIKRFFNKNAWIKNVRDKLSNHYDITEMEKGILRLAEDDKIYIFLSETTGNTLFFSSSEITLLNLLKLYNKDINAKNIDRYHNDKSTILNEIVDFIQQCMMTILEHNRIEIRHTTVKYTQAPHLNDIHLPYFIER